MNTENTITMRNNRRCCFVISRSRVVSDLKQRNRSMFFPWRHAKITIKSKEDRYIMEKMYKAAVWLPRKFMKRKRKEKFQKKNNVYEKNLLFRKKNNKKCWCFTLNQKPRRINPSLTRKKELGLWNRVNLQEQWVKVKLKRTHLWGSFRDRSLERERERERGAENETWELCSWAGFIGWYCQLSILSILKPLSPHVL